MPRFLFVVQNSSMNGIQRSSYLVHSKIHSHSCLIRKKIDSNWNTKWNLILSNSHSHHIIINNFIWHHSPSSMNFHHSISWSYTDCTHFSGLLKDRDASEMNALRDCLKLWPKLLAFCMWKILTSSNGLFIVLHFGHGFSTPLSRFVDSYAFLQFEQP